MANNQVSDSAVEPELKFQVPALAPAQGIESVWLELRLQNDLIHRKLKTIVLFVQFACPIN